MPSSRNSNMEDIPLTAATQPTRKPPRKVRVKEGKSNAHERFLKENMRMIVLSAGVSLCFACCLTFLFMYIAPATLNYVQDGILDIMTYLRGPGDKSMITASEADQGIPKKWLPITMNLTREHFYTTYHQKEIVVFPGHILDKEVARNEALKVASRGSGKKVTIHDFVNEKGKESSIKSLNEFRKMKPWNGKERTNIYMEESSQLLAKVIAGGRGNGLDFSRTPSQLVSLDLGGDFKFTTMHNGTGPPFRQERHRLYEVLEGTTQWLFFHPKALPTIGYSEADHYTSWMRDVYPSVSPLFSPLQLTLRPGNVLYIPEGYYYTYTAETEMASMILQEASMEDAGTELYCLEEGTRRMLAGDYVGAAKLFNMGLELPDDSESGQGRHSHRLLMSLGRVHEKLGRLESAETAYRDAISQNARHTPAYSSYMDVVMRTYEEKKRVEAKSLSSSPPSSPGAGAGAGRRGKNKKDQGGTGGASSECASPVFVEARNEARYKIRNAAALAETSGVLTEALSQMNSTMVAKVNSDKETACSTAEL